MFSWIWAEHQVHGGARKRPRTISLIFLHSPAMDPEGWHRISAEGIIWDAAGCLLQRVLVMKPDCYLGWDASSQPSRSFAEAAALAHPRDGVI